MMVWNFYYSSRYRYIEDLDTFNIETIFSQGHALESTQKKTGTQNVTELFF